MTRVAIPRRRFFLVSCLVHAALLGGAWAFGGGAAILERPVVLSAAWTASAELPPDPEPPPPDPVDVERPRFDETSDDVEPIVPTWSDPDALPATIAVAAADGDPLLRTTTARIRSGLHGDGNVAAAPAVSDVVAASSTFTSATPDLAPARAAPTAARAVFVRRPKYPESARTAGIEGDVLLEVDVLADGTVGDVRVVASSGDRALDAAAVAAARAWRFEPATDGVSPVPSVVRLPPVRFRLRG